MSSPHSLVRPTSRVVLRLPSGILKPADINPNTTISIGKFGSFPANSILNRPYHLTYEIIEPQQQPNGATTLRVIPPSELHAESLSETLLTGSSSNESPPDDSGLDKDLPLPSSDPQTPDLLDQVAKRNNRLTIDDTSRQTLSMSEIESLKKAGASGREVIAAIVGAHTGIEEKTAFSLAKYTARKEAKFLKRFTVLPMTVAVVAELMLEKEPQRTMELREETLGLITSWANVHYSVPAEGEQLGKGRWLVVDDTSGLVVAAMADKMGLLYPEDASMHEEERLLEKMNGQLTEESSEENPKPHFNPKDLYQSATSNTITLVHAFPQPNLSLLKYFGYSVEDPSPKHPLYSHLHTISWLQLLEPMSDSIYSQPPPIPAPHNPGAAPQSTSKASPVPTTVTPTTATSIDPVQPKKSTSNTELIEPSEPRVTVEPTNPTDTTATIVPPNTSTTDLSLSSDPLASLRPSQRASYYRKLRRHTRIRNVVSSTRQGQFDGVILASWMRPTSVLSHLIPLVRGGGKIVVYSPTVEPLTGLSDAYSRERRGAWVRSDDDDAPVRKESEVDPTLVWCPALQSARARRWQVLPGRTHPVMTSRGGADGFVWTGTRVCPIKGGVQSRGNWGRKRRKVDPMEVEGEAGNADVDAVGATKMDGEMEIGESAET